MDNDKSQEIISSLKVGAWSFSDERAFMENLYVGRFNYFLVVFSLFLTAGFANQFSVYKSVVFYAGAFLLFLIWLLLYRGYKKHDRIMQLIFRECEEHPAYKLQRLLENEGYRPKYRVSRLMGVYIPWLCILFLLIIAFGVSYGCIK